MMLANLDVIIERRRANVEEIDNWLNRMDRPVPELMEAASASMMRTNQLFEQTEILSQGQVEHRGDPARRESD
jgi:hypothetical protein